MPFTSSFKAQFAIEFARYPTDQQDKILEFIEMYEANGLSDFTIYPGKISPSWSGIDPSHPNYNYARYNNLWHYHIGIPQYILTHGKYLTSDWVLHFQWVNGSDHISLVDLYSHHTSTGIFYMPPQQYLED